MPALLLTDVYSVGNLNNDLKESRKTSVVSRKGVIIMKRLFVVALVLSAFIFLGYPTILDAGESKKKLYTACNIWVHTNMKCINYKMGEYILAGTEVTAVGTKYDKKFYEYYIYFKKAGNRKKYKMVFNPMWHPGKTTKDVKKYMFTEKPFDELVEGMTEKEIEAIKQGKIVAGMSKKAVLVSYGRPPEHRTPDLKSDNWRYWMNKRKRKEICFHNGLTMRCIERKKLREKLSDEL